MLSLRVLKDSKIADMDYFRIGCFLLALPPWVVSKCVLAGVRYKPSSGRKVARGRGSPKRMKWALGVRCVAWRKEPAWLSVCANFIVTRSPSPDFVGSSLPEGASGCIRKIDCSTGNRLSFRAPSYRIQDFFCWGSKSSRGALGTTSCRHCVPVRMPHDSSPTEKQKKEQSHKSDFVLFELTQQFRTFISFVIAPFASHIINSSFCPFLLYNFPLLHYSLLLLT